MNHFRTASALAAIAFSATVASAADLPPPSVYSPTPVSDWSGLYAGSFAGVALGSFSTRQTSSANGSAAGFTSGALIGYAWRHERFVYGVEGDVDTNVMTQKFSGRPGMVANQVDSIYALHARGRLGYDVGIFEPFVTAGLAYDLLNQYRQSPNAYDGASSLRPGWTIGAGVDTRVELPIIGPSVLRAEYLYENVSGGAFDLNGVGAHTSAGVHYARLALITRIGDTWRPSVEYGPADWSGNYVGALGGFAHANVATSGSGGFGANGGFAGVYSGHNWMFGNAMLGIDGSTSFGSVDGSGPQPGAAATHYHEYFMGDFRGRAGYALGRFMPYIAAGFAYGDARESDPANGNSRGAVANLGGTLGAGVEAMVTDRVSVRAEYDYSHSIGSATTGLEADGCCAQSHDSHTLRMGIGYFFH